MSRVRANTVTNFAGTGTPSLPYGIQVGTGATVRGSTNTINLLTNGSERLRVRDNGRLMTGADGYVYTSSSSGSLSLYGGNSNLGAGISFSGGNSDADIKFYAQASTATPAERMRIDSSGNVGIGTDNPNSKLDVIGDTAGDTQIAKIGNLNADGGINVKIQRTSNIRAASFVLATGNTNNWFAGILRRGGGSTSNYSISSTEDMSSTAPAFSIDSTSTVYINSYSKVSHPNMDDLQIGNSTGNRGITISSGDAAYGTVAFGDSADGTGTDRYEGFIEYYHADDSLRLGTSHSERLRIDSSGRLLLGAASDVSPAGFNNRIQVNTDSYTASILLRRDSNNDGAGNVVFAKSRSSSLGGHTIVQSGDDLGKIIFYGADGTDTDTPAASIEAAVDGTPGTSDMPGRLMFKTTPDGSSSSTERMRITGIGSVGIGDNDPHARFQVKGNTAIDNEVVFIENHGIGGGQSGRSAGIAITSVSNNSASQCYGVYLYAKQGVGGDTYGVRAQAEMTSSSSAAIGVLGHTYVNSGATNHSPSLPSGGVCAGVYGFATTYGTSTIAQTAAVVGWNDSVYGSLSYGGYFRTKAGPTTTIPLNANHNGSDLFRVKSNGQTFIFSQNTVLYAQSASTSYNDYLFYGMNNVSALDSGGTVQIQIQNDGDVKNTDNSYGAISDIKLKENIVDASSQWDDIKALKVRNYNFKEGTGYNTHRQLGLIAQELEPICPGLVDESPDRDKDGNDLGTVTKSVNYSVLYMKAIKGLQEAMTKIETLEAKVAALEAG